MQNQAVIHNDEKPAKENYPCFVRVCDDDASENFIELPTEQDGSMLLSTIQSQYPNAIGLKYKSTSGSWRGVRLSDNVLDPPFEGWQTTVFTITLPKTDSGKRKMEESPNREPEAKLVKTGSESEYLSDLIVLGLPYKAKEEDVKDYFQQFGELAMHEIKYDPFTKQSRGFAFIRYKTIAAAQKALKSTHNILGRRCEVRLPKKKEDMPLRKLFIGRLPDDTTQDDLERYFRDYGDLTDVYIPTPFRGFGFVTFASSEVARDVLHKNHTFKSIRINVTQAEPKGEKMSRGGGGRGSSRPSSRRHSDQPFDFEAIREVMPYNSRSSGSSNMHYSSYSPSSSSSRRTPPPREILRNDPHDSRSAHHAPSAGGAPAGVAYNYSDYHALPGGYTPAAAVAAAAGAYPVTQSFDARNLQYGAYWSTSTTNK